MNTFLKKEFFLTRKLNSCFYFIAKGTDAFPHDNGIVRAVNAHYKPNERIVGDPKHTVFIGRLHMKTDEVRKTQYQYFECVPCQEIQTLFKRTIFSPSFYSKLLNANFEDMVKS